LPCGLLAAHGKEIFAVQQLTAKIGCTAAPDFPVVFVYSFCVHTSAVIWILGG
jgi:hypothetical protein